MFFSCAHLRAKGAHPPKYILPPDIVLLRKWVKLANNHIRMITIAAERPGAAEFCREAVRLGIRVSLGHQMATEEDVARLVEVRGLMIRVILIL